ncbi:MAG: hypothetical protein R2758_00055 [Bacteroidales bacterium]
MLLHKLIDNLLKIGASYLLESYHTLVEGRLIMMILFRSIQGAYHHCITVGIVDGGLEVLELLLALTHGRKKCSYLRVVFEGLGEPANGIKASDQPDSAAQVRRNSHTCPYLHLSMSQCRSHPQQQAPSFP